MNKDQALGVFILLGSLAGVALYFYLAFLSPWVYLIIQMTAFVAVAGVLVILAWIGYTLATTPPPMPIEDFKFDEELDSEKTEKKAEEKKE